MFKYKLRLPKAIWFFAFILIGSTLGATVQTHIPELFMVNRYTFFGDILTQLFLSYYWPHDSPSSMQSVFQNNTKIPLLTISRVAEPKCSIYLWENYVWILFWICFNIFLFSTHIFVRYFIYFSNIFEANIIVHSKLKTRLLNE